MSPSTFHRALTMPASGLKASSSGKLIWQAHLAQGAGQKSSLGGQGEGIVEGRGGVGAGFPEGFPGVAGFEAAQGQDVPGARAAPEHARLFAAGADDGLTAGFDDA